MNLSIVVIIAVKKSIQILYVSIWIRHILIFSQRQYFTPIFHNQDRMLKLSVWIVWTNESKAIIPQQRIWDRI